MKIAFCQMENRGSVEKNLQASIQAIKEAARQRADLILFPEVQLTEFFPPVSWAGSFQVQDLSGIRYCKGFLQCCQREPDYGGA